MLFIKRIQTECDFDFKSSKYIRKLGLLLIIFSVFHNVLKTCMIIYIFISGREILNVNFDVFLLIGSVIFPLSLGLILGNICKIVSEFIIKHVEIKNDNELTI